LAKSLFSNVDLVWKDGFKYGAGFFRFWDLVQGFPKLVKKGFWSPSGQSGPSWGFSVRVPRKRARFCLGACKFFFVCAALCYDAWSTMIHT
jgi:hypothetical protein